MFLIESKSIPQSPGCYLFKDEVDQVIYVGKSKFLPKRVMSYFQKRHDDLKTQALVESIKNVEFIITESEADALVVEENLIKLYQPKYNIKGKDDKTIRLTLKVINENFSRVDLDRNSELDGEILAQFTSGMQAREIYKLLHQVFPLRSCSYNLSEENIAKQKFKSCLEYHMENCLAPCLGEVKPFIYKKFISEIKEIFSFNPKPAQKSIRSRMIYFSKNLEFEKAAFEKNRLDSLYELVKKIEPLRLNQVKETLKSIGKTLHLKESPLIIEAFDNSHTSGLGGVACSVRFVMGKPEKSSYRKFIIQEKNSGDDYASFEEVLTRRFTRIINEKIQPPHLIVMDGGIAQVNVCKRILDNLGLNIDIIGLSKDDRHRARWIHLVDGTRIDLLTLEGREILASISEEVHRFTIKFHTSRRDKIK